MIHPNATGPPRPENQTCKNRVATHPTKNVVATLTTPQHRENDMDNSTLTNRGPDARGMTILNGPIGGLR